MIKEHSAGIIVYHVDQFNQRAYLLLHYISGHWDFPKGKLETQETEEEAALRELYEETGLIATIMPNFKQSLSYIFKNRDGKIISKDVSFFVGPTNTQNITLSAEHVGYRWLPFKEALAQLTFKNAQHILKLADQFVTAHHAQ